MSGPVDHPAAGASASSEQPAPATATTPAGEHERPDDRVLPAPRSVPFTQQLGRVVLVLLIALFGVFASYNAQRVDFSWVVGRTEVVTNAAGESTGGVPLILLLLAALAIGIAIGALVEWQFLRGRRARKEAAKDR